VSERLRVLIIGPYPIGNTPVGGVETAVAGLAAGLGKLEAIEHVHVADMRPDAVTDIEVLSPKITIHRLPAQKRLRLLNSGAHDVSALRRLSERVRPDIVHGQGIGLVGLAATRLGLPSVVTVHGMVAAEARVLYRGGLIDRGRVALVARSIRRTVARAGALISISEYDRDEILQFGIPRRHVVIPNAVRPLCEDAIEPVCPTALFAGVIIPRKDIVGIVAAFQRVLPLLTDARLVIAGAASDPDYAQRVQEQIAAHPEGIEYVGSLDRVALGRALGAAGLLVLFSGQETLPCIIAEAMLSGRPVVSSSVGGVPEMIEDGVTGILIAPGDVDGLAEALLLLLGDKELRVRMGAASRERAAVLYDARSVAQRTLEVYHDVLEDL
jgi:glycosyltransferase involved in cell wall biosynthesis